MKSFLSFSQSIILSGIVSITLSYLLGADLMLGAMVTTAGWFAVGKINFSYILVAERVVARSSDIFRIPRPFFIYLAFMVGIAVLLIWHSFIGIKSAGWDLQTVDNFCLFSLAMAMSILIGLLRWVEVKKTIKIEWKAARSILLKKDIYLPQN